MELIQTQTLDSHTAQGNCQTREYMMNESVVFSRTFGSTAVLQSAPHYKFYFVPFQTQVNNWHAYVTLSYIEVYTIHYIPHFKLDCTSVYVLSLQCMQYIDFG